MNSKTFIFFMLFLLAARPTYSWGPTGHRAVGKVAEQHLNKKAQKELQRVLGQESLAMASTWMDEVRSDSTYDYMVDWHWVTIPDGQTYDQSLKNPHGDVIQTLERVIKELKSHALNKQDELQRVKLLIHLVGDLHQPMHVGGKDDRGGNDVKVSWFKTDSNLHRVWDSDMIDDTRLSYTEFAESLYHPNETEIATLQKASIRDMATESMAYRPQVYDIGNGKLGYGYSYKNFHIVRQRVMQAGIRLAGILNEIYG